MKINIILTCTFLAILLICGSLAARSAEEDINGTVVANSTSTSTSDSNLTIPIIVLVEQDNNLKLEKDSNTDYATRDLKWLVVRKITNISKVEEISTDDETGKTKRVLMEDRAEEFRVFKDDRYRQVLDERDVKSIPFPLRFL